MSVMEVGKRHEILVKVCKNCGTFVINFTLDRRFWLEEWSAFYGLL